MRGVSPFSAVVVGARGRAVSPLRGGGSNSVEVAGSFRTFCPAVSRVWGALW